VYIIINNVIVVVIVFVVHCYAADLCAECVVILQIQRKDGIY